MQFENLFPTLTPQTADSIYIPIGWFSLTPSDTTTYVNGGLLRGIYVGTTGNVAVVDARGVTTTIPSVPAGMIIPGYFQAVMATNTTASNLCGIL